MQGTGDERFADVQAQVAAEMERLHVPGVAVGIIDGNQVYVGGQGVTNVDHPLPVDGDTLFQIGSTSKTVTALLAMRPISRKMPSLKQCLPDIWCATARERSRSRGALAARQIPWADSFPAPAIR